jgi:hypothetical protein
MPDLHILIKKSSSTAALRALAFHAEDVEYLVITPANATTALALLSGIGADESIFSATEVATNGNVTGILVPKSAGK